MPFPRKLLNDNENIILDMHPHWWFYGPQAVSTVVVGILGLWILGRFDGIPLMLLGYTALAGILVSGGWLIVEIIKWRTTSFVVTNYRVISRAGTLSRHGIEIPLDKVNNVNFRQSIFQRLLGMGDLEIDSGESATVIVHRQDKDKDNDKDSKTKAEVNAGTTRITHVPRPEFVQNTIHKAMNSRATGNFRPAPSHGDIADQLERLEGLRDRGALTDEEFEQQKRRLLG
ncbi:MAG: hypothetical protein RL430_871 [Actinomycetota bacterium]|jgi:uncharacterized membrane protein YdbT with pleckstrin-like domain